MVVVKVDEPEVSTETMAEVVTAEEEAPEAPEPTAVKMVVEPMVEPLETMAEVVMAEDEAPEAAPTTVKMVVEPMVEPLETMAEVVMAEDEGA
jgi:hypothetical protein